MVITWRNIVAIFPFILEEFTRKRKNSSDSTSQFLNFDFENPPFKKKEHQTIEESVDKTNSNEDVFTIYFNSSADEVRFCITIDISSQWYKVKTHHHKCFFLLLDICSEVKNSW